MPKPSFDIRPHRLFGSEPVTPQLFYASAAMLGGLGLVILARGRAG